MYIYVCVYGCIEGTRKNWLEKVGVQGGLVGRCMTVCLLCLLCAVCAYDCVLLCDIVCLC
jgi:hypothetical protein